MKLSRILGVALLSVALSSAAQAQSFSQDFNDPSLFGSPVEGAALNGVTYSNPTFDAFFLPTSFDCATSVVCDGVIQGTVSGTLGFTFGGPLSSLQLGLVRVNNMASYLTLYDVNGQSIATQTLTPSSLNDPSFGAYFGGNFSWTASGTFAYSAVLSHDFDAGFDFEAFELDNLSGTVAQPVPEPMTASLLGIGLVAIVVARRRRDS